ncbi:MAG: hypothetical protein LBL92_02225 [Propionibacteriaceae bacterium]|jgi:hypothetical protein|nr:hypothetical protein [Propionibacteriaceae bacterium]
MPTTLKRIGLIETPEVEHSLAVAASRWPNDSKAAKLARLVAKGTAAIEAEDDTLRQQRLDAINEVDSGRFAGLFPPGFLRRQRDEDWD